jgi:hypothetical protein
VSVSGGATAFTVNPGTGRVTLRGLAINGLGGGIGVDYQSGAALYLERLTISGFTVAGLNAAVGTAGAVFAHDVAFRGNAVGANLAPAAGASGTLTASFQGVKFETNGVAVRFAGRNTAGVLDHVVVANGGTGIAVQPDVAGATSKVDIRASNLSANSGVAVQVGSGVGGTSGNVTLLGTEIADNGTGLAVQAGGAAWVTGATITRNAVGLALTGGGTAVSSGDNRLVNNASNGNFSSTTPKQ